MARLDIGFRRIGFALAAAVLTLSVSGAPARAQNIFEALFGGLKRQSAPAQPAAQPQSQPQSYVDPYQPAAASEGMARDGGSNFGGRGIVYCVRTCDGRYFPLSNHAGASAAEICRAFCPYASTQVFAGSKIDYATAPGGKRYSDMPNAFVYRTKMVADCTCDGKSPTGLVRLPSQDDPTLRSGDIVATGSGLMAYRGGTGMATQFSAISNTPGISANMRQQLTATKVAPGKQPLEEEPDPEADGEAMMSRNVDQRSQASR